MIKKEITFTIKRKRKEIMVFEFFISIKKLFVFDFMHNH